MEAMRRRLYILAAFVIASLYVGASGQFDTLSDSIYSRYLRSDVGSWKPIIDKLHNEAPVSIDSLDFLLSLEYGYVAWCVSDSTCKDPDAALDKAFKDLAKFEEAVKTVPGKTVTRTDLDSKYRSYYSAFLAYQIKLNAARAIINGWRCVNNAKGAVTAAPNNWFSQLEYGNVMHYMPTILGGSKINARKAYNNAIRIMEEQNASAHNWMYLHALLCLADCYKLDKDYANVKQCYDKILETEPDFALVRDNLAPSLARQK